MLPQHRHLLFTVLAVVFGLAAPARADIEYVASTEAAPWQPLPVTASAPAPGTPAPQALVLHPETRFQAIIGFGGCFNELGWQALRTLPSEQQDAVMTALFSPAGANFTTCRMGIGANDFALAWYSLDETPGDYAMADFNLDEDRKTIIPFILAAKKIQPALAVWGAPWSPPSWMKTNGSYKGGKTGHMKQDPQTLSAYALYLSKFVQEIRAAGVPLRGLFPQNEPTEFRSNYPQCGWDGTELAGFIRDYLLPRLDQDRVQVEVWLGTLTLFDHAKGIDEHITPAFNDPALGPPLVGLGGQYGAQGLFAEFHARYPAKKILQTETECFNGLNLWKQGLRTFSRLADDSNNFANGYLFWNMILNETGMSSWGWRQNSLVTIDTRTHTATFNPEFYALLHFGHFVLPGAVRIGLESPLKHAVAFQNPDGTRVVCFSNDAEHPESLTLNVGAQKLSLEAPALSMNTVSLSESP